MLEHEPLEPWSWKNAKTVVTESVRTEFSKKARKADVIYLDVETTGIRPSDHLRLVQIGFPDDKVTYLLDPRTSLS